MRQYIGVEIESVVNGRVHNINRHDYSFSNYKGRGGLKTASSWYPKEDSSISTFRSGFNEFSIPVEFVSKVFKSEAKFKDGLARLKKFLSKNGVYELFEVINFNKSCGCHIHLSTNEQFYKKASFEILESARELFFKKIKNSNIKSKQDILNNYFREYAEKTNKDNWRHIREEFNTGCENSSPRYNKGFEWRSLNLCGVRTWAEFDEYFNIVYECFDYLTKKLLRYSFKSCIYPKKYGVKPSASQDIKINTGKNPEIKAEVVKIDVKKSFEPKIKRCSRCDLITDYEQLFKFNGRCTYCANLLKSITQCEYCYNNSTTECGDCGNPLCDDCFCEACS